MAGDISFASFNLYNLQEPGQRYHRNTMTQELYDEKLSWTQAMLKEVDADIIVFQELWAKRCLEDVFSDPALSGYTLTYICDPPDNSWYSIAVAVAVRSPWRVKRKTKIKKLPFDGLYKVDQRDGEDDDFDLKITSFSRTVLNLLVENTASTDVPDFRLFAAHLKSKLPSNSSHVPSRHRSTMGAAASTIRRTAEAAGLRWLLNNAMKGTDTPTVVVGDLNDDPRSNTLAILTEQPSLAHTARGGDNALYSVLQMQQLESYRDVYYTHEYKRMKDTLDHILVSQEFFEPSARSKWKHRGTRIWNDYLDDDARHTGDHGIIRAEFKFLG